LPKPGEKVEHMIIVELQASAKNITVTAEHIKNTSDPVPINYYN
jgi:hypothetical protein